MTIKLHSTGNFSGLTSGDGSSTAGGETIPTHILSAERIETDERERARWAGDLADVIFLRRRDFVVAGDRIRPTLDGRRVSLERLREVAARERRLVGKGQYESTIPYDHVDDEGNLIKTYPSRGAFLEAQRLGLPPASVDVAQRDLRRACIHEAAHAAVAGHFGIFGRVTISKNPAGSLMGEKFFTGACSLFGDADRHQLRMISLAGSIAELVYAEPDASIEDIMDWWAPAELSASDARGTGDYTSDDIEECLTLVQSLWPKIVEQAEYQVRDEMDLLEEDRVQP